MTLYMQAGKQLCWHFWYMLIASWYQILLSFTLSSEAYFFIFSSQHNFHRHENEKHSNENHST